MSDFEKEKQAFNEWYNGNTDDSWFFVNNINCLDKTRRVLYGFYGGYHSRDEEITRLRAEIDKRDKKIASWDYVFGEDGPTEITKKLDSLRAEIERLEREREEIIRSRDMYHDLSSLLQAEIERKDKALQKISDHVDIRLELYKCNRDAVYGLQSIAVQALKSKEKSDE